MVRLSKLLPIAAFISGAAADGNLVEHIDMYRGLAMPAGGVESFPLSNNNLADAMGVLRYIHQEIIVEHSAGDPARPSRKYGLNAIARYRMQIRNPDSIIKDTSKQSVPGYGGYGAFDYGVATSSSLLENVVSLGDYVGASVEDSPQINFTHPWYWFSVDGDCPNLPWTCIAPYAGCTEGHIPVRPGQCDPDGCAGKSDPDARTCPNKPGFVDPSDLDDLRSCCLHYADSPDTVIIGGLCNSTYEHPTGEKGCVYKYETMTPQNYLNLDAIVGMTSFYCGEHGDRFCKDWADWRINCYDPDNKYRYKFTGTPQGGVSKQEVSFCVEYDLHPACQDTPDLCKNAQCMSLSAEEKEIGLPFWQGKCDVEANQRRAETVVGYLLGDAVRNKHLLVDESYAKLSPRCSATKDQPPNQCTPNADGGPFCTRMFGGVCSTCYIPGTEQPYPLADGAPMCPYTVARENGNQPPIELKCKSRDPLDLCCLYQLPGNECNTSIGTKGADAEFSSRGYMVVNSLQSNQEMVSFATRWVKSLGGAVKDQDGFNAAVYWLWHYQPPKNPVLAWQIFQDRINSTSSVDWHPSNHPDGPSGGGGMGWLIPVVVIVALLAAAALGFGAYKWKKGQQQARTGLLDAEQGRRA